MVKVVEILIRANPGTHGADLEAEDHATNGAKGSKNYEEAVSVAILDDTGFIGPMGDNLNLP